MTAQSSGLLGPDSETIDRDEPGPAVAVQDDGTVWLLPFDGGPLRVRPGHAPEALDWTEVYDGVVDWQSLAVTPDGEAWLMGRADSGYHVDAFFHYDGTDWEVVSAPEDAAFTGPGIGFDVGPDGSLWTVADSVFPHQSLARYDGSGWTIFGEADGVRAWGAQRLWYDMPVDTVRVAPDGSAWVNATVPGDHWAWRPVLDFERPKPTDWETDICDGLARFDGTTWSPFLSGMCIGDYDFGADGAVWVVARDGDPSATGIPDSGVHTYVITPEAVAAAE